MRVCAALPIPGAASADDEPDDNSKRAQDRHDPQARLPGSGRARGAAEPPPPEEKIERRVQRTDAQSDEELRRRVEERPGSGTQRVEVIEVPHHAPLAAIDAEPLEADAVLYKAGMSMADVERAAIAAALKETRGNRRKAAEVLGIGERTLYRKLKEYAIV